MAAVEVTWYGTVPGIVTADKLDLALGLRGAVAVLAVASLETFLRDLFEAAIDDLNHRPVQVAWNALPQKLRHAHIFEGVRLSRTERQPGESEVIFESRMLQKAQTIAFKLGSPTAGGTYILLTEPFTDTNANPDADRITTLAGRLGIKSVFDTLSGDSSLDGIDGAVRASKDLRDIVDRIVQRRHHAAHGRRGALQNVARTDLQASIAFLRAFAASLEKTVMAHIANL